MRFYLLLLPVVLLTACTSPHQDPRLAHIATPTDFSVVVRVRPAPGPGSATSNPLNETSVHAVEPNRRLGVTRGRSADTRYPGFVRVLTRQEYDDLFKLVSNNHLIAEPTSPGAEAFGLGKTKASALYEVEITAFGRTNRYRTTPDESPPTVELLTRLIQLRSPPTSVTSKPRQP